MSETLQLSFLLSQGHSQLLLFTLTGRGLVNLVSFRDILKLFCIVYLPVYGASYRMESFNNLGGKLLYNNALKLEPQVAVRCLTWVLGSKLGSSGIASKHP